MPALDGADVPCFEQWPLVTALRRAPNNYSFILLKLGQLVSYGPGPGARNDHPYARGSAPRALARLIVVESE